jgi:hypothetical protein
VLEQFDVLEGARDAQAGNAVRRLFGQQQSAVRSQVFDAALVGCRCG